MINDVKHLYEQRITKAIQSNMHVFVRFTILHEILNCYTNQVRNISWKNKIRKRINQAFDKSRRKAISKGAKDQSCTPMSISLHR